MPTSSAVCYSRIPTNWLTKRYKINPHIVNLREGKPGSTMGLLVSTAYSPVERGVIRKISASMKQMDPIGFRYNLKEITSDPGQTPDFLLNILLVSTQPDIDFSPAPLTPELSVQSPALSCARYDIHVDEKDFTLPLPLRGISDNHSSVIAVVSAYGSNLDLAVFWGDCPVVMSPANIPGKPYNNFSVMNAFDHGKELFWKKFGAGRLHDLIA